MTLGPPESPLEAMPYSLQCSPTLASKASVVL